MPMDLILPGRDLWLKLLKFTALEAKFTEHDLRAKVASNTDVAHAQNLLGHSSPSTTERVFRRKPTSVKPTK